jgi:hypothetical protein
MNLLKTHPRAALAVAAIAAIATALVVAPALGGPSLKSLVKKEVSKQIAKATGPQGPAGANGTNGTNGVNGTARAYATVTPDGTTNCNPNCQISKSKGVTNVTNIGSGDYCVFAPGIDAASVSAVAAVNWNLTTNPEGNASANPQAACAGGGFGVQTDRIPSAGGPAASADDVGFNIIIP